MLGNDVVDLGDADACAGARHPRFEARVFAEPERRALAASEDPERLRWVLWSAKESAYKAARRVDAATVFSPPRFVARLRPAGGPGTWSGHVAHDALRYRVHVATPDGCVHAVATHPGARFGRVVAEVRRISDAGVDADAPGRAVRELARAGISRLLGIAPGELAIERRERIPHVRLAGGCAPLLSLSHHGGFVAWACLTGGEELRR